LLVPIHVIQMLGPRPPLIESLLLLNMRHRQVAAVLIRAAAESELLPSTATDIGDICQRSLQMLLLEGCLIFAHFCSCTLYH